MQPVVASNQELKSACTCPQGCSNLQGKAKGKALSTAFVTFKDTFTTTTAATSMMHHDQRYWNTRAAPAPKVQFLAFIW